MKLCALVRGHYPGRKLPRGALAGVKTVGFWDADHDQDWGLDWHHNEGVELTFLETGAMAFAVDHQTFQLRGDDLTVTRPWQLHRVGGPNVGAGRLHWLILDLGVRRPHQPWKWPAWLVLTPADRNELTDMLRHNEQPVWHAAPDMRRSFQRIAQAVETDESGSNVSRLAVQLNELFVLLLDMFRRERVPLDRSLSTTRRTVELFLADLRDNREQLALEWSVGKMAQRCGLGTTQFVRYSRQLTNLTPMQYLNTCRLETAARMLVDLPERSVIDVALDCGFSSSQYFATVFRRQFGCTPRAFRRKGT